MPRRGLNSKIESPVAASEESKTRPRGEEEECASVKLTFLVGVRKGFTKRLMDTVQSGSGGSADMKVLMDGPYCSPPVLRGYETVVLIAGGSS